MNFWIFNHYASPPDRSAGTRHYELGQLAVKHGHKATIFASGFSHATLKEERLRGLALFRTEQHDGVRFVWLRTLPYRANGRARALNMLTYFCVVLLVQVRFSRPEVVIGSSVHPLAALAGYLSARLRGSAFVYEIRDLWPQTLVDMGAVDRNSVVARALWRLEAILTERAELVIGLMPGIGDYFRQRKLHPKRLMYIPNGAHADAHGQEIEVPQRITDQISAWGREGRIIVGYVGAHGDANGLETVVQAAAILANEPQVRAGFLLVGDGPARPRLTAMVAEMRLENIRVLGPVSKAAVCSVLANIDVGLFHLASNPVFRFGVSSNKLWDYFAHCLPVIFACNSAYDPVAMSGAGVTIEPGDPEALADAVRRLAGVAPMDRAHMGALGNRYLEAEHNLEHLALRLEEALRVAAGANR
jgi:glycosyltransferase involved in cell wall biosynthesis